MRYALCLGSFAADVTAGRASVFDIMTLAGKYGFDAVEIREDLLADKTDDLPCIKKIAAEKEMDLIYASRIWPLNTELDKMKESALLLRQGIEDTAYLCSDTYKVGFGPVGKLADLTEKHFEIVEDFVKLAEARKITLCLENSDKSLGGDPAVIKAFIEKIGSDHLKTTYDCGNYAALGQDPLKVLGELAGHTGYVHLKDVKDGETSTTWIGDGNINFAGILKFLKAKGFDGFLCLEFAMSMDRLEEIEKSLTYLKSIEV